MLDDSEKRLWGLGLVGVLLEVWVGGCRGSKWDLYTVSILRVERELILSYP